MEKRAEIYWGSSRKAGFSPRTPEKIEEFCLAAQVGNLDRPSAIRWNPCGRILLMPPASIACDAPRSGLVCRWQKYPIHADYGRRASAARLQEVSLQRLDLKVLVPRHEATVLSSSVKPNGLDKKPFASLKTSGRVAFGITEPVIMMTFVFEWSSFALLSTAIPSTPGMLKSVMTRSKKFC